MPSPSGCPRDAPATTTFSAISRRGCVTDGWRSRCRRRRFPRGAGKSPLLQPDRQPGAPARRVDDEVGGPPSPASSSTPVTRCRRGVESGFGDTACTMSTLAIAATRRRICHSSCGRLGTYAVNSSLQPMVGPQHVARGAEVDAVRPVLQNRHARGDHVVEQTGKVRVELLRAAGHQQMDVPVLGHRGPVRRSVGQFVALVDRDPLIEVRQDAGGAQARDAGPDDDRVFSRPPHRVHSTRYIPDYGPGKARSWPDDGGRNL